MLVSKIYIRLINVFRRLSRAEGVVHSLIYKQSRQVRFHNKLWGDTGTSAQRDYHATVWSDIPIILLLASKFSFNRGPAAPDYYHA